MATTITPTIISGSTDGKQIKVTGTATGSSVTIHTADASATDYITLWATNNSSSDILLTIEWGGTTSPDDLIEVTMAGRGTVGSDGDRMIVSKKPLTNSLVVKAFAGTADVIKISGSVERIA